MNIIAMFQVFTDYDLQNTGIITPRTYFVNVIAKTIFVTHNKN